MIATKSERHLQRGSAALILIMLVLITGIGVMFSQMSAQDYKAARDRKTAEALAEAKAAIIAWSVNQAPPPSLSVGSPGQLPCPEETNSIGFPAEGTAKTSCSLPAIGRLPWKTLGLGDIRDGNGDRLWYAISTGFRASPINSDTQAQLTVNGVPSSAVAIIFSTGSSLSGQNRTPPTFTSPPNVVDYLDLGNSDGDNVFVSQPATSTFNDQLLIISHTDLFSAVEKRVLREAKNCLDDYYAIPNNGKYPWALPVSQYPSNIGYEGTLFGRIPLNLNVSVSGVSVASMPQTWSSVPSCSIFYNLSTYWNSNKWNEVVFYQISPAYQPTMALPPYTCTGNCLMINGSGNPNSGNGGYHVVLTAAGGLMAGQFRSTASEKSNIANYLELGNAHILPNPSTSFEAYRFNDAGYSQVNDQMVCLDGRVNCK